MCDNFIASGKYTTDGRIILAKNSDREPNEAQALNRYARRQIDEAAVQTTFIRVPQVRETYEVVLSKPFQMWGAEMGVNEYGLAIGNEALFTVVPIAKKNTGLTGMDMLRLALERSRSADQAVGLITELIEKYGQDACGGYQDKSFYYYNSFAVADPHRAFVLESVDRHWAVVQVDGFRSISNGISLEGEFDQASEGIEDFAVRFGKHRRGTPFSLRGSFSDFLFTSFSGSKQRRAQTMRLGEACRGKLDVSAAMDILRSHGHQADDNFEPAAANNGAVCMHAAGPITRSQTTGSLVAELVPGSPTFWFTGTSAPCLSVFKPVYSPGQNLSLADFAAPGATPDRSLWWRHERLHRFILRNYQERAPEFVPRLRELEAEFVAEAAALTEPQQRDAFSQRAFERAHKQLQQFEKELAERKWHRRRRPRPFYSFYRRSIDRSVGLRFG